MNIKLKGINILWSSMDFFNIIKNFLFSFKDSFILFAVHKYFPKCIYVHYNHV